MTGKDDEINQQTGGEGGAASGSSDRIGALGVVIDGGLPAKTLEELEDKTRSSQFHSEYFSP